MKITDVRVIDPRAAGKYENPVLIIKVDEPVYEIAEPVFDTTKSYSHRLIPCGPFYAVEFRPDSALIIWKDMTEVAAHPENYRRGKYSSEDLPDYGDLNKRGLVKDQLFPVEVITSGPDPDVLDLCMPVARVRRLLRKHVGDKWQLIVDEQAALLGLLKWRLELSDPVCYGGATPGQAGCTQQPDQIIVNKGTHLTLCQHHANEHSNRLRKARALSSNH